MNKKKIILIAVAAVVVASLGVAGFLLVRGFLQLNRTGKELADARRILDNLYEQDPFPSAENIALEKRNVAVLNDWRARLGKLLRQGQVQHEQQSPSSLMSLLGSTKNELMTLAKETDTALPADFAFGFDRYFGDSGALPAPSDVPRLTRQIYIVDRLCRILMEEGATEIVAVERDRFEAPAESSGPAALGPRRPGQRLGGSAVASAPGAGAARRDAGLIKEGELYGTFHFGLEFKAPEQVVWDVLNQLADEDLFIVVTGLEAEKTSKGVKAGPAAVTAEGAAVDRKNAEHPIRIERMLSGPELETPLNVRLDLDVYRFAGE